MRKVYLFDHNKGPSGRVDFVKLFEAMPEILEWRYDMASCFYLVSEHDADTLANRIRDMRGKEERFLVTEISDNYSGWTTEKTWYLLENKRIKNTT